MLHRFFSIMLVIAILGPSLAQAKAQSFTLKISAVQNVVKVGSNVRVKIELKNTSEDDISLGGMPCGNKEGCPELQGYHFIVRNFQGKEPPLTKWGRQVFGRPKPNETFPRVILESVVSFPLSPGQTYTTEIIVSNLYDLSVPGIYTIQIFYAAYPFGVPLHEYSEESKQVSNVVTITVEP
jgi:hypothetical protein